MSVREFTAEEAARKAELRRLGKKLYGRSDAAAASWTESLAAAHGVQERRVRSWAAEPPRSWLPVPGWLLDALRAESAARAGHPTHLAG